MTTAAVVALSLAIGVGTAMVTFVSAYVARDLPFREPDTIVSLGGRDERGRDVPAVSYQDFEDWEAAAKSFAGLALMSSTQGSVTVSGDEHPPQRYSGPYISANAFRLLGVEPSLGRDFRLDDDVPGAPGVALISSNLWRSRYAGDPSIVGRTIRVNAQPTTIVGVMPGGFQFPVFADIWIPLGQLQGVREQPRNARTLAAFGRLGRGITLADARAELAAIGARRARPDGAADSDISPTIRSFHDRYTSDGLRLIASLLMGAVVCILLIAFVNVAHLIVTRAAGRRREMALRLSLGATHWQVGRQLIVEGMLMGALSGTIGFLFGIIGIRVLKASFADAQIPFWVQFTLDGRVYAFLVVTSVATVVLFGLTPVFQLWRIETSDALKEGGHQRIGGVRLRWWSSAVAIIDVAVTVGLLTGVGLMTRSVLNFTRLHEGIDTSSVLVAQVALPAARYRTQQQRIAFQRQLEERLTAITGVESAAVASHTPLFGGLRRQVTVDGQPAQGSPVVTVLSVSDRYFDTIGLRLTRGEPFTGQSGVPGREEAIVNERFAAMNLAGTDVIGNRIRIIDEASPRPPYIATIVGVAHSLRQSNVLEADPDPVVYVPYRAEPLPGFALLVRSRQDTRALVTTMRAVVQELDQDLPLFNIQTLKERLGAVRWNWTVTAAMSAVFAGLALILAAVGVYAITAYTIARRTREIGIRIALGARAPDVWILIGWSVGVRVVVGLAAGIAVAVIIGRLMQNVLLQTSPMDVGTLVAVPSIMSLVATAAVLLPTRRAIGIDPSTILRSQ